MRDNYIRALYMRANRLAPPEALIHTDLNHFTARYRVPNGNWIEVRLPKPEDRPFAKTEAPLANLLRGKRVVVVGGAPLEEGEGVEIDQFDLVIRVNNGYRACAKAPSRQGFRTDAVYHCLGMANQEDYPDVEELRRLAAPIIFANNAERLPHKVENIAQKIEDAKSDLRITMLPPDFFIRNGKSRGVQSLHSGTVAILHAAQFAAEVHTRGITFYRGAGYDPAVKDWDEEKASRLASLYHSVEDELKWFAKNIPTNVKPCAKLARIIEEVKHGR